MERKRFLSYLALILLSTSAAQVFSDSFDDFLKSQHIEAEKIKDDFQIYQEKYLDGFEQYKRTLLDEWQTAEVSNQDTWVSYSKDLKTKTVVDFLHNEIRISYKTPITTNNQPFTTPKALSNDLASLLNLTEQQAIVNDPITQLNNLPLTPEFDDHKRLLLSELNEFYGSPENAEIQLRKLTVINQETTPNGEVTTVTISLPEQLPLKRAEKYFASAIQSANKWGIEPALVMAIAHTESHFNPLARSHIPAFGLMQIVPASAGKDASKLMTGKSRLLTSSELYDADFNLETGSAYLNLLQTRYLKGITNPTSRMYCVIAAYNTGSGNVAKAFVGSASIERAFTVINQLTPEQVYATLKKDLPYAETRRYIVKVIAHRKNYLEII
jgi:membrane-bound lytic murein transglycosylase C